MAGLGLTQLHPLILSPAPPKWFSDWNVVQVLTSTGKLGPFLGVW